MSESRTILPPLSPGEISKGKQDKKLGLISDHIPESASILHIGCAGGEQSDERWMHRRLDTVAEDLVGIDIHEEAVQRMKADGWDVRTADAHEFEIDKKFEVIAAPNVIEHLHSPGQFLKKASDHLKRDGVVLVTTPRIWSLHHVLTWLKDKEVIVSPKHTQWFDDPTFCRLVELSPFEVARHETFRWQRLPASRLDQLYLLLENVLERANINDQYIDYQHFYCLKQ